MTYVSCFDSPIGQMLLRQDGDALTGLWLEGQKYYPVEFPTDAHWEDTPLLEQTKDWLNQYFAGQRPQISQLPLNPRGTDFQRLVWKQLCRIPYGQTVTYGWIARQLAEQEGRARMSAQAVGGAVGHNEISIIIPCHRVVGTSGSLTGYAGGMDRKIALLKTEHVDMSRFFVPKKGTAL